MGPRSLRRASRRLGAYPSAIFRSTVCKMPPLR